MSRGLPQIESPGAALARAAHPFGGKMTDPQPTLPDPGVTAEAGTGLPTPPHHAKPSDLKAQVLAQAGRFGRLFLAALVPGIVAQYTTGNGLTQSAVVGVVVGALEVAYRQFRPPKV